SEARVELLDGLDQRADQAVVLNALDAVLPGLDELGEHALDVLCDDAERGLVLHLVRRGLSPLPGDAAQLEHVAKCLGGIGHGYSSRSRSSGFSTVAIACLRRSSEANRKCPSTSSSSARSCASAPSTVAIACFRRSSEANLTCPSTSPSSGASIE